MVAFLRTNIIIYIMEKGIITTKEVQEKVLIVHGQKVLLDRDVAALYGVETKAINQAVKNNPRKFSEGYLIQLNDREKEELVKILTGSKV